MAKKLKDFPYVEITVRAYDTRWREGDKNGLLAFVVQSSEVTIGKEEGKIHVGSVDSGMSQIVVDIDGEPGGYFQIAHADLWQAVADAIKWKAPRHKKKGKS